MDKDVAPQAGNNHPTSIPTGVFETKDGYINIAATGQVIWERFCKAMDAEDMMTDARYANGAARSENRDALNADINRRTKERDSATWIEFFNEAGVPAGEINSIDQVFADPQVEHLKMAESVQSGAIGDIELVAQAVRLHRTPSTLAVAPPERGEHTDEVLQGLGYSADEVAAMRERNVV